MTADYDRWKTADIEDDARYCAVHDFQFVILCPHCRDDEADRQHDEQQDRKTMAKT